MKQCVEGDIVFDFSLARTVFEHDTTATKCDGGSTPDGNTGGWKGVDFRLEDDEGWIWLEIKDWRGQMRGSYSYKMQNRKFAVEMRYKFLGTTAHLAWKSMFTPVPVRYVLLFEPPTTADHYLLAPFQDLIRKEMYTGHFDIRTFVMSVNGNGKLLGWNDVFDYFPAHKRR